MKDQAAGALRFLVVDDDEDQRNALVLGLEMLYSCDIIEAVSGNQAITELKKNPGFAAVISEYDMPDGNGGDLFKYMLENRLSDRFVLFSVSRPANLPEFKQVKGLNSLPKPFTAVDMERTLRKLVNEKQKLDSSQKLEDGYCKIKPVALQRMNLLPCDIFVKLSDQKYVKMFQTGDMLSEQDLEKLHRKKIDYLYMQPDSARLFLDKLQKEILNLKALKAVDRASTSKLIDISQQLQSTVHQFVNTLGMVPEVEELVKMNVGLTVQVIRKNPDLNALFSKLTVDPNNYITSHSLVLSYIACAVASKQEWYSDSTYQKLTMAALMHDICLTNERIAHYRSEKEMLANIERENFSTADISSFHEHPRQAAKLLSDISDVPPDVDTIILQHHESPDGTGFPTGIQHHHMSPLSSVFIIAHDILRFYELHDGKFDPQEFLILNRKRYANHSFQKILNRIPGFN